MQLHGARPLGRTITTALACALAAAIPAHAARVRGAETTILTGRGAPADDSYDVAMGEVLHIVAPGVLANDGLPPATDEPLVSLVTGPSHGSLDLAVDGGFKYVAARGFSGLDSFSYAVHMSGGRYGQANVTVNVGREVDLAVTASASPEFVELGAPATFTFAIVNQRPGDAEDVRLQVAVPPRMDASEVRPDTRCGIVSVGRWLCPMGPLPMGSSVQAAFTVVRARAGVTSATATISTPQTDPDPANNSATAVAEAGRLSVSPGLVTGRVRYPIDTDRDKPAVNAEAALTNESVSPLTFEVQAQAAAPSKALAPWLTVTPGKGAVDPDGAQPLTVTMSAAGLAPGLRRGTLHFVHDSPFTLKDVPVSFTVAFRDVAPDRSDDASIHALAGAGVTGGCEAGWFCPDASLTRAGAAVWLLVAGEGGGYVPPPAEGQFGDVPRDRAEAPFIEELVRRGVAQPCATDPAYLFCPDAPLARAEAAVMVLRALEGSAYEPPAARSEFRDMRDDARAPWVNEAVRRGLFAACAEGPRMFCPDAGITRGDAAVSVVKAFNLPLY